MENAFFERICFSFLLLKSKNVISFVLAKK